MYDKNGYLITQRTLGDGRIEYPSVRAFALAPGFVPTRLTAEAQAGDAPDTVALPAATILYLTSGRADWFSGRFVHVSEKRGTLPNLPANRYYSSNWDIAEVERDWKDVIVKKGGLVNKLYIPRV
jgi:hypothetical protein